MKNKVKTYLAYGSSYTGEFVCSYMIFGNGLHNNEGEVITYEEPIPSYHLSKYDPNAKGGISSINIIPVLTPKYITINFTISPSSLSTSPLE
jgi:hypothetical protein